MPQFGGLGVSGFKGLKDFALGRGTRSKNSGLRRCEGWGPGSSLELWGQSPLEIDSQSLPGYGGCVD